ncbi:MAG: Uma2 family endonuclease, partial [Cyanobacteriota bacterium]|nr:Uma2 family endonuclease [Cyanobacteriota bacterium]
MTQTLALSQEQHFIQTGVSWPQFKLIQAGFKNTPGVRLFYYKGEVEILAVSKEHELISRTINILLAIYFEVKAIEFEPTGSFNQEREGEASAQADESYFLGSEPKTSPDLSVEVVITSGSTNKLNRYQVLGVPEVWFWEDGLFQLYRLGENGYDRIYASQVLPDLNLELLTRCVLMTSRLEAMREFR